MKHRETLDEAIDRVATRMTQIGGAEGVEIQPIWWAASSRTWLGGHAFAKTLVGVVGVAAIVLAVVMVRALQDEEPTSQSPIAASTASVWLPLTPPAVPREGTLQYVGAGLSRPKVRLKADPTTEVQDLTTEEPDPTTEVQVADRTRSPTAPGSEARPTWGIPFIEAPAALAVAAPRVAELEIDAVAVESIEIAPLTVSAIEDGVQDSKEQ